MAAYDQTRANKLRAAFRVQSKRLDVAYVNIVPTSTAQRLIQDAGAAMLDAATTLDAKGDLNKVERLINHAKSKLDTLRQSCADC